jgi:hypothetical protein
VRLGSAVGSGCGGSPAWNPDVRGPAQSESKTCDITCECPRYGKRVMVLMINWNKVIRTFAFFTGCLEQRSSQLQ